MNCLMKDSLSLSFSLRYLNGGISGNMGPHSSSRCLWATCAPSWAEWTAAPPATPTPVMGRPIPIGKVCPVRADRWKTHYRLKSPCIALYAALVQQHYLTLYQQDLSQNTVFLFNYFSCKQQKLEHECKNGFLRCYTRPCIPPLALFIYLF